MYWTVKEWQNQLAEWQDATFPDSTLTTTLAHLRDEVNNELNEECAADEIADCVFLLMGFATKRGIDIEAVMREKFQINIARKWSSEINKKGFFSHCDDTTLK